MTLIWVLFASALFAISGRLIGVLRFLRPRLEYWVDENPDSHWSTSGDNVAHISTAPKTTVAQLEHF
jgi:hypothetical protein